MARIVAGFASSHTPLRSLPGQDWAKRAEDDKRNRELVRPSDGKHVSYDELLADRAEREVGPLHRDVALGVGEGPEQPALAGEPSRGRGPQRVLRLGEHVR